MSMAAEMMPQARTMWSWLSPAACNGTAVRHLLSKGHDESPTIHPGSKHESSFQTGE